MLNTTGTKSIGRFIEASQVGDVWLIRNKRGGDVLGGVEWYTPWRQYVFSADETAIFSHDCLSDIAAFITGLQQPKAGKEGIMEKVTGIE